MQEGGRQVRMNQSSHPVGTLPAAARDGAEVILQAGEGLEDGRLVLLIEAAESRERPARPLKLTVETRALVPPDLRVVDSGMDDDDQGESFGNGDGRIARGETIEIQALVQNKGQGEAASVRVAVSAPDEVFYMGKPEFNLGDLGPGEHRPVGFAFSVPTTYAGSTDLRFGLKIEEARGRFGRQESVTFTLDQAARRAADLEPEQVVVRGGARPGPTEIAPPPRLTVDVEQDIPQAPRRRKGVAVVIGNRQYEHIDDVEFAGRDARVMGQYLEQALGFRRESISLVNDASKTDFESWFGSTEEHRGKLYHRARRGADIFVYYSGHGHSEGPARPAYLVPADAELATIAVTGYPLRTLYDNLKKLVDEKSPGKLVVVMESCFSGYLAEGVSSTRWSVDNPLLALKARGVVVMSAASGRETAKWYREKKHGLFTYFLLKAMHNSPVEEGQGRGDADGDGRLTLGEVRRLVGDRDYGVPYWAGRLYHDRQTPVIVGDDDVVLMEWKR